MSDDDIDFDRVVSDPAYRRAVIAFLNFADGLSADSEAETPNSATVAGADRFDRPEAPHSRP